MAMNLGTFFNSATAFALRTHVQIPFTTHAAAGANVAPSSAFEAADISIYRAAEGAAFSATQRSSAAGITMVSPFDSLTGFHDVVIDLTDNTDAGFYAQGYRYAIVLSPDETIDSQTITAEILAFFDIGISAGPDPSKNWTDCGIAQAATATTIRFRSAATFANNVPIGSTVLAYGSTQAYWQSRVITGYASSNDEATVPTWDVTPSGTISYIVVGSAAGVSVVQTGDCFARLGAPAGASVSADIAAIEAQTDDIGAAGAGLTAIPWNAAWDAEVQSEVTDALEVTLADSIPADGTLPSVKQALYMLTQFMLERSVSSTTCTVKKADGSTTLFQLTLNSATAPTSITRSS